MRERLVAAFVGSTLARAGALRGAARLPGRRPRARRRSSARSSGRPTSPRSSYARRWPTAEPVTPALLDDLLHEARAPGVRRGRRHARHLAAPGPTDDPENLRRHPRAARRRQRHAGAVGRAGAGPGLGRAAAAGAHRARRCWRSRWSPACSWRGGCRGPSSDSPPPPGELGTGEPVVDVPHSRIPEAEEIGEAIRTSAAPAGGAAPPRARARRPRLARAADPGDGAAPGAGGPGAVAADARRRWPPSCAPRWPSSTGSPTAISQLLDRSRDQRRAAAQDVDLDALVAAVVAELGGTRRGGGRRAAGVRHEAGGAGTVHVDRVTLRLPGRAAARAGARGGRRRCCVETVDVGAHVEIRVEVRGDGTSARPVGAPLSGDAATQELARALGGQLSRAARRGRRSRRTPAGGMSEIPRTRL